MSDINQLLFQYPWISNIIIVAVLVPVALWRRDAACWFLLMFCYFTLHHAYVIFPIFSHFEFSGIDRSNSVISIIRHLHLHHGWGPQLVGALFLAFMVALMVWHGRGSLHYLKMPGVAKLSVSLGAIWVILAAGSFFYLSDGLTRSGFKDIFSTIMMLVLGFIGMFSLLQERQQGGETPSWGLPVVVCLMLSVMLIAAYEVTFALAYSGEGLPDGRRSQRGSSFLFNPNALGVWGAMTLLLGGYAWVGMIRQRWMGLILVITTTVTIFLSGSRSAFLLSVILLLLSTLLLVFVRLRWRDRGKLVVTYFLIFGFCLMGGKLLEQYAPSIHGAAELSMLSDRYFILPAVISGYLHSRIPESQPQLGTSQPQLGTAYQNAMYGMSVRLNDYRDNGYLGIKALAGPTTYYAWILLMALLIFQGIQRFLYAPSVAGVFIFSAMAGCVSLGLILRAYQVFPIWGMISLVLAIYLTWLSGKSKAIHLETSVSGLQK